MTVTEQPKNMIDFNNAAGRKGQRSMLQPQKRLPKYLPTWRSSGTSHSHGVISFYFFN